MARELKFTEEEKQNIDLGVQPGGQTEAWKPGKHDRMLRRRVYDRWYELRDDPIRTEQEKQWEQDDKDFQQYVPEKEPDEWRADFRLPDSFAAIETMQQERIERKARPILKRVEDSDKAIEQFGNAVLNHSMNVTGFDYQYFLVKYAAAIRGTSFAEEYYRLDKRVVSVPSSYDKETGKITYEDIEMVDFDDTYTEWVKNEEIYPDNNAADIDSATDYFRRRIMSMDDFLAEFSENPNFKNVNFVKTGGDTTTRSVFKQPEDMEPDSVEVLKYTNKVYDEVVYLANNIVIREEPNPHPHKQLGLAVDYCYRIPGQFWGIGVPKAIRMLSEERRTIRMMNLDRQKMHIQKMFLHNSAFDLDDEDLVTRPFGLISVDTNGLPLDQVIRPVEYGDVPVSYFRTEEVLLEDIRRATGIDDRIQGVNVGGTATEAAILKESSLKRINMISLLSEMDFIRRIGRLKWINILFFYPLKRMETIVENNRVRTRTTARKISVEGREFRVETDEFGKNHLKALDATGATVVKLDKKYARYLQGEFDIVVDSSVYAPISKPLQQAKVTEAFSLLMSNPVTMGILDPRKSVERYLSVNEENPNDWMKEGLMSVGDMMMLAESENLAMSTGTPLAPTPNATEEHTMVHLMFTRSAEFEALDEVTQQLFMDHILGEYDAMPNTGNAADLLSGYGLGPSTNPAEQGGMGEEGGVSGPLVGRGAPQQVVPGLEANSSQPAVTAAPGSGTNFAAPE